MNRYITQKGCYHGLQLMSQRICKIEMMKIAVNYSFNLFCKTCVDIELCYSSAIQDTGLGTL